MCIAAGAAFAIAVVTIVATGTSSAAINPMLVGTVMLFAAAVLAADHTQLSFVYVQELLKRAVVVV
jgi:hypothetical protein